MKDDISKRIKVRLLDKMKIVVFLELVVFCVGWLVFVIVGIEECNIKKYFKNFG